MTRASSGDRPSRTKASLIGSLRRSKPEAQAPSTRGAGVGSSSAGVPTTQPATKSVASNRSAMKPNMRPTASSVTPSTSRASSSWAMASAVSMMAVAAISSLPPGKWW